MLGQFLWAAYIRAFCEGMGWDQVIRIDTPWGPVAANLSGTYPCVVQDDGDIYQQPGSDDDVATTNE